MDIFYLHYRVETNVGYLIIWHQQPIMVHVVHVRLAAIHLVTVLTKNVQVEKIAAMPGAMRCIW